MSEGTFDAWQQVFTMSMLANRDSQLSGNTSTLQGHLADVLQNDLSNPGAGFQALIGSSWEVAWGPCVYENPADLPGKVEDNAMFVAHNTATNMYVVAIAATNPTSNFDVLQEDKRVNPILAWPYGQTMPSGASFPAGVAIAPGTTIGVNILQSMQDSTGQSLAAFLQSVQSTSATLVFTGHSLGGALAPTLACAPGRPLAMQGSSRSFPRCSRRPRPGHSRGRSGTPSSGTAWTSCPMPGIQPP